MSVANIAAGELGANPRVRTKVVGATAIDDDDDSYDLVVFAQAFHHLPPATAVRAIAEATRIANRFLVIDLKRLSAPALILTALLAAPLALVPAFNPLLHEGFISNLRAYSRSAFIALGTAAHPQMRIEFMPSAFRFGPAPTTVVFSRPSDPLRHARLAELADGLRPGHRQGAQSLADCACRPADRAPQDRLDRLGVPENLCRPWLLLPAPCRRCLPLRQHLRNLRQLRPRPRTPTPDARPALRHPPASRRRRATPLD
jgi:hypothetical protein